MSGNKKLKQHDLRKAMHDLKMKNKAVIKRIESPLAKYPFLILLFLGYIINTYFKINNKNFLNITTHIPKQDN